MTIDCHSSKLSLTNHLNLTQHNWVQSDNLGRSSLKTNTKVWILSKGEGGSTPNPNFFTVFLVEVKCCSKVLGQLE